MNSVQSSEMSRKQSNKTGKWQVMLHNDNHNTFNHVITCLMSVCGHNYLQSVQCANIVHKCGKCSVFIDKYDECEDVLEELHAQDLTVSIIKYKKQK
jgi:ATP-dependent Clp protease adaptor protein ClpS